MVLYYILNYSILNTVFVSFYRHVCPSHWSRSANDKTKNNISDDALWFKVTLQYIKSNIMHKGENWAIMQKYF